MNPIVKEFLLESNENLSLINEEMTKFEKNPDDKELGRKVRYYINWLRNVESNGNSK